MLGELASARSKVAGRGEEKPPSRRVLIATVYVGVLGFAFFLLFYNLDGHLLWGDEAETATLAKNVLRYGVPKSFDGVNRITLYGPGVDSNKQDVWIWSPWLQEYVTAAAFGVLGPTTWASRVLFTAIGWGCLVLLAWMAYRIYRNHWVAIGALALMGTSEVFLLHARQCRYYTISVLGELILLCGIYQLLAGQRRGQWSVAVAVVLQFYSNYIFVVANLPVLLVLGWMLYRRQKRMALHLGFALVAAGLVALPWLIYAHAWQQLGGQSSDHMDRLVKAALYLREYHFHFMPLVFLLLPAGSWIFQKWRPGQAEVPNSRLKPNGAAPRADFSPERPLLGFEWLLVISVPVFIGVVIAVFGAFTRYLIPLLPGSCLLMAAWAFRYIRLRAMAVALLLLQCTTNALALASAYSFRGQHVFHWPLFRFCHGSTRAYEDRFADVLDFLKRETQPGQTVLSFDSEFPVIFYTQLRVVDCRFNREIVPPLPEWIFPESPSSVGFSEHGTFPDVLRPYYDPVSFPVHNSLRRGGMPEPDEYQYDEVPDVVQFTVYRKKPSAP